MEEENQEQQQTQESTQEQAPQFTPEQQAHIDALFETKKNEWETEFLNPLVTERDELKSKVPQSPTEQEIQLQEREAALTKKEIKIALQGQGYGDMADLLNVSKVEDVENVVKSLNNIMNTRKIENSYQGSQHKSQCEYEQQSSKGNALGMIASKLKTFNK